MDISVIGTGYVGIVTGACLAKVGHHVICADIDAAKVASLREGIVPFHEPGLPEVVDNGLLNGSLSFTTNVAEAVRQSAVVFIAVGTPPRADGSANTDAVFAAAQAVGNAIQGPTVVVVRSTVPVGTTDSVRDILSNTALWHTTVLSNPEFLREGHCIEDFTLPARVVIGAREQDREAVATVSSIYREFVAGDRLVVCDVRSAEFAKYACNAFLATKISFINEIAVLCDKLGANVDLVRDVMGRDPRIGSQYLAAGIGYGGSCLPKDVAALRHLAADEQADAPLLAAVEAVNQAQPGRTVARLRSQLGRWRAGRSLFGVSRSSPTPTTYGARPPSTSRAS
jgi:UDPglucose 6-dehydrogenase